MPEETPWLTSFPSTLRKSDDTLPILQAKSSTMNDTRRRNMSSIVYDTKSYPTSSPSKRDSASDDEGNFDRQEKSKVTFYFYLKTIGIFSF